MQAEVVWVPFSKKNYDLNLSHTQVIIPTDDSDTKAAVLKVKKMVSEGWSIVSTVPITGSISKSNSSDYKGESQGHSLTFTTGYEVWLQKI